MAFTGDVLQVAPLISISFKVMKASKYDLVAKWKQQFLDLYLDLFLYTLVYTMNEGEIS